MRQCIDLFVSCLNPSFMIPVTCACSPVILFPAGTRAAIQVPVRQESIAYGGVLWPGRSEKSLGPAICRAKGNIYAVRLS